MAPARAGGSGGYRWAVGIAQPTRSQVVEHLLRHHARALHLELGTRDERRLQIALLQLSLHELRELHDELHEGAPVADVIDVDFRSGQRGRARSGSANLSGFIDEIERVMREGPELIGDVARPIVDTMADLVNAVIEAWAKLTGLPQFALVAYVYLEMTKREQQRVNARGNKRR